MISNLQFLVQPEPFNGCYAILLVSDVNGQRHIGTSITMHQHEQGVQVQPTMRIDRDAAQQLFQQLWDAGLRPLDGTGSAGQLKATENHLADMRRLVFEDRAQRFQVVRPDYEVPR